DTVTTTTTDDTVTTTTTDDTVTTTTTDDTVTTTTTVVTGENDYIVRASVETEIAGFYFNHDPRPFKTENANISKIWTVDAEGNETDIEIDPSLITFEEVNSKADNPEEAYDVENTTFKYTINVFYDGKKLVDADDNAITFTAYIGLKGDTNLDNIVDAKDASNILAYYSNASTLEEGQTVEDVRMSPATCKPVNENPELDLLCVFLGDVDRDVYSKDNWKTTKSGREIDAKDSSSIFAYYSYMSTDEKAKPSEGWNSAIPAKAKREEKLNAYIESGKEE
ncbi:MAG: cellulose-binding protein CttA-related protein, partial [Ruminococcus sp.]|nr:cellulose-binding protein CttA-related protein [Ruminococcus sp.]